MPTERTILTPSSNNGLLAWPDEWRVRYHNGTNEPCDMLIGPCACGAWHSAEEWGDPDHACPRSIHGSMVLAFYNALIADNLHNPDKPDDALTLSYF